METKKTLQTRRWWLLLFAVLSSLIVFFGIIQTRARVAAAAQDAPAAAPSPTPDEEKERLQREKDLATLRKEKAEADKAIAEAHKAEFEARFPKPTTSPLEGKTTVEGAVIESQMISYVSLARAADRIVAAIKSNFNNQQNLAIYNEHDINLMLSYRVATSQINQLGTQGYCKILTPAGTNNLCPLPTPSPTPCVAAATPAPSPTPDINIVNGAGAPPLAPLAIAQSFLGAFVDMTALLRTNVEIKGQTFVIDEAPLAAEIFRAARGEAALYEAASKGGVAKAANNGFAKPGRFYYPYVFPPNVNAERASEMLALLENLHKLRGSAAQLIDAIEKVSKNLEKAEADIKDLTKAINETLPKQSANAVVLAGNLIEAHCRRLSADVKDVQKLPQELQAEAMLRLIEKVKETCKHSDPDKLAQIYGLGTLIKQTAEDLQKAKTDLNTRKGDKARFETELKQHLAKLKLNVVPPTTTEQLKDNAIAAIAQLKAINAQFDNLITSLVQSQAGGVNPLTNYIRTERLLSALCPDNSYWMMLKVINAGGNNRIKTNLVVDIFTGGNRVSHSGGVIVQYHLFDSNGLSVASGTVSEYTNYIKADKVRDLTGSNH